MHVLLQVALVDLSGRLGKRPQRIKKYIEGQSTRWTPWRPKKEQDAGYVTRSAYAVAVFVVGQALRVGDQSAYRIGHRRNGR
jgi:hypothetical protein